MLEIYLCRHGQSVANSNGILAGHIDSPLSKIGKEQAREVAELAKASKIRFNYIYTSPLRRSKETARIIAKTTGSPAPRVMEELKERNFGILTGKHYTEIPKLSKKTYEAGKLLYILDAEDFESFPQLLRRASLALKIVENRHKEGKILLSTHGDIGMMLYAAFHKTSWKQALKQFHFGNSELLLLKEDLKHKPHVFLINQRELKIK